MRGVRFITGRVNSLANIPHVLELVQAGRLHPELVTTELIPWREAASALRKPSMKPLVFREPALAR